MIVIIMRRLGILSFDVSHEITSISMVEVESGVKFNEWFVSVLKLVQCITEVILFRLDQVETFMITNRVDSFLINNQIESLVIGALGVKVPKSKELRRKLFIDSILADGKKRFMILTKNNVQHVSLVLKPEWLEDALESWRVCIAEFLANERTAVDLSRLGSSVRRPWPCGLPMAQNEILFVPRYPSLKEALLTDPLNRFKFFGEGSTSLVALSKKSGKINKVDTTVAYHDSDWTVVKRKQQQLNQQIKSIAHQIEPSVKSDMDFRTGRQYPLDWRLDDDSTHSDDVSSSSHPFESDLSSAAPAWNPPGMWDTHTTSPERNSSEATGLSDDPLHPDFVNNNFSSQDEAPTASYFGLPYIVEDHASSTANFAINESVVQADEGYEKSVRENTEDDKFKKLWFVIYVFPLFFPFEL